MCTFVVVFFISLCQLKLNIFELLVTQSKQSEEVPFGSVEGNVQLFPDIL